MSPSIPLEHPKAGATGGAERLGWGLRMSECKPQAECKPQCKPQAEPCTLNCAVPPVWGWW